MYMSDITLLAQWIASYMTGMTLRWEKDMTRITFRRLEAVVLHSTGREYSCSINKTFSHLHHRNRKNYRRAEFYSCC